MTLSCGPLPWIPRGLGDARCSERSRRSQELEGYLRVLGDLARECPCANITQHTRYPPEAPHLQFLDFIAVQFVSVRFHMGRPLPSGNGRPKAALESRSMP